MTGIQQKGRYKRIESNQLAPLWLSLESLGTPSPLSPGLCHKPLTKWPRCPLRKNWKERQEFHTGFMRLVWIRKSTWKKAYFMRLEKDEKRLYPSQFSLGNISLQWFPVLLKYTFFLKNAYWLRNLRIWHLHFFDENIYCTDFRSNSSA